MLKPVLFGSTIQNMYEASLLVERGGAKWSILRQNWLGVSMGGYSGISAAITTSPTEGILI